MASTCITMKLHLLVILPSILFILLHSKAWKAAEPVYDTKGEVLISGEEYYIIPFNYSRPRGGVVFTQHNTSWHLFVAQDDSLLSNDGPVTIIPITNNHPAEQAVTVSSNVHVQFVSCATCLEPMMWKIGDTDQGANGRRHIVAGDLREDARHSNNQFIIEKHTTGGYELVFCPKVCKLCRSACRNVGLFIDGGRRWLGLEGSSLTIVFKKNNFEE